MAFLTTSDISSSLPLNYDAGIVDRLLVMIESELRSREIYFESITSSVRELEPMFGGINIYGKQAMFYPNFVSQISTVKVKRRGDSSETALTLNTDYILSEHENISGYYTRFEILRRPISAPEYLEVSGKFGLQIDFTDTSSLVAKLLKAGIVEFIRNQLALKKNLGQGLITSASEAGSSISYATSTIDVSRSIWTSPDMRAPLDYILC